MEYKIMQGVWGDKLDTTWEFFLTDKLPTGVAVSAVMGLPFWDGKIVLAHTKRGWEIPGGHVEEGEDVETCLRRELLEEVGASSISAMKLFGYRKITNPERKKEYPHNAIMPYYVVQLGAAPTPLADTPAEDAIDFGLFKSTDALVVSSRDYSLIITAITAKLLIDKFL